MMIETGRLKHVFRTAVTLFHLFCIFKNHENILSNKNKYAINKISKQFIINKY